MPASALTGRTLVVSAFEPEIAPLRRLVRGLAGVRLAPVGVGAVDAAAGAARAILQHRPRRVLFVGTAGVYPSAPGRDDLPIGGAAVAGAIVCVSTAALRGDGYLPEPQVVRAEGTPRLSALLSSSAGPGPAVACPLAITRSAALARRIATATGASLENLEVFAVARAAAAAGVDFAAVLGVANRVGPLAHDEWRAHHRRASRAAATLVARWLRGAPDLRRRSDARAEQRSARIQKLP
ncbi:MAG TPA: phosphorylase [Polyangia bacterium]|nr:phosphorylase [Polyangia bacterium]